MQFSLTSILLFYTPVIYSRSKSYRRSVEVPKFEQERETTAVQPNHFRPIGRKKRQNLQSDTDSSVPGLNFGHHVGASPRLRRMNEHNVNIQVQATYGSKWDVSNVSTRTMSKRCYVVSLELWSSAKRFKISGSTRKHSNAPRTSDM